jgi:hypothetical protein
MITLLTLASVVAGLAFLAVIALVVLSIVAARQLVAPPRPRDRIVPPDCEEVHFAASDGVRLHG